MPEWLYGWLNFVGLFLAVGGILEGKNWRIRILWVLIGAAIIAINMKIYHRF